MTDGWRWLVVIVMAVAISDGYDDGFNNEWWFLLMSAGYNNS